MARFRTSIETGLAPETVFDELADFTSVAEWDPSVSAARRIDEGPIVLGSRFLVTTDFLGRALTLRYEVVAYERPRTVVLEATTTRFVITDDITVTGDGTVHYVAGVEALGLARLVAPIVGVAFRLVGGRAATGLERHLQALGPP
jgi:dehydrogenase/reductase SDR family member 12